MGWWFIPIRMPTAEIEIHADRRLAFQVATAWGAAGPNGKPSNRILREEDDRLLIEFSVPVKGMLGRTTVNTTQEWVTTREPEWIAFHGQKGPLPYLRDRFTFEEWGPCTRFKYESTFAAHGSIAGWIVGMLYVRPILKRFMREHVRELKATIEARAARSHVYPQQTCPHLEASHDDPARSASA